MMIDSIALRTVTRKHIVAGARSVAKRLISQAREKRKRKRPGFHNSLPKHVLMT
jgi:hypothetical protein